MQTFKLDLRFQATVIVPDAFLEQVLDACQADDATPFLRKLWDEHYTRCTLGDSTEDESLDILVAAVMTNALRKGVQANTSLQLANAGLGCRVSPVEVLGLQTVQPRADSRQRAADALDAPDAGVSQLTQGAAVQLLQDARAE